MTANKTQAAGKAAPKFNRVMIIDDMEIDRDVQRMLMSNANFAHTVDARSNAAEVVAELRGIKRLDEVPDLIFLDLQMPGMNGFEFLKEFETMPEYIKNKCRIVIVSGNADKKVVDITYTNPSVIEYVEKPLDANDLRKIQNN